ncbi:hypothetical protein H6F44_06050 [Pseudanabaena sp. FACHB-1277]|uniref:Uncharacterized protein n=1 Tax=Pseudanabaena cinerea FACHB-1277 TaxID=2949581 RepID=A0A926URF0_9CYAN|nr:hypothetical protein [Pseudanabaena cinerea]MBD2149687.1 hypothetical protein [Pseudanabaena cinerea FACHB-1277]
MSKAKKTDSSDDSKSKSSSKSASSKLSAKESSKESPKLEVLKVIAPKSPEVLEEHSTMPHQDKTENLASFNAPKSDAIPAKEILPRSDIAPLKSAPKSESALTSQSLSGLSASAPMGIPIKKLDRSFERGAVKRVGKDIDYSDRHEVNIDEQKTQEPKVCLQPIPVATEPFQYRAIGVISGRYVGNEDNFAKGHILTSDGAEVDAVLLGKVISVAKKRLQNDRDYLWVVYPRTNDKSGKLHVQIAGVWAPEDLGKADIQNDPGVADGYFSIRGEVSSQSIEDNLVIVKIRRIEQKFDKQKGKPTKTYSKFKVRLTGLLPTDAVGQFWSVNVQRQGNVLSVIDGEFVGIVPVKGKRNQYKGRPSGGKFAPRKFGDRPYKPLGGAGDDFSYPPRSRSTEDRPPVPRPIIKRREPTE